MASAVAVVAGAGGGIGGACAEALRTSHDVVVCVDRDGERADATATAIRRGGGRAETVVADAAHPEFGETVAAAARSLGPVRSAVHAVAYEEHTPALDLELDSVRRSFTVGPLAAFALFRALVRADLCPAGAGLTVIGSLHERYAFARCLGYNAAHGALGQVVRTLAHEWADRRIRVNAVVPGWIATPGEVTLYGGEHLARAGRQLPFGSLGDVGQVAAAVTFLSSPAADYVSGSFLTVDGALAVSLARLPEGAPDEDH